MVNKFVGNSRFVCQVLIAAMKVAHSRASLSVPQCRVQPLPSRLLLELLADSGKVGHFSLSDFAVNLISKCPIFLPYLL